MLSAFYMNFAYVVVVKLQLQSQKVEKSHCQADGIFILGAFGIYTQTYSAPLMAE